MVTLLELVGACLACNIVYFLPTFIACARRSPRVTQTLVVNALLGWTVAGWAAACYLAIRRHATRPELPDGSAGECGPAGRQFIAPTYRSLARSWLSAPVAGRAIQGRPDNPSLN
jgi:Superinfection immunity protein